MVTTKKKQSKPMQNEHESVTAPLNPVINTKVTVKVLKPVLGRKVGEVFEADFKEVRLQIKHRSLELA